MTKYKIFNLTLILLLFTSCEVEFSPNDQWHNIPVVYCLLDQDDDTTYVRLQRCFLGEGNNYEYASIADSINYPQGSVTVLMEEWNTWKDGSGEYHASGDNPRRIYNFAYTEIENKTPGLFYNEKQPIYTCETRGQLDSTCIYRLKVIDNASGDTIAKSETMLVHGRMQLQAPNNVIGFNFAGATGSKKCEITWSSVKNARQYQPVVRFLYRDFIIDRSVVPWDTTITPHFIDIPCNVVKSNMRDPYYTTNLDQNHFLMTIKETIGNDTCNKNVMDSVYIFVYCCSEPMAAYIYAGNPAGSLSREVFTYSNIEGGLGVFAARRRHIYFAVESPVSAVSDYIRRLKELGVGF